MKTIILSFSIIAFAIKSFGQVQIGQDIDGETYANKSGYSICMPDAKTVAIGAPENSDNGWYAGHVRIFTWNGITWVQKGTDIDGEAIADYSGCSVSMPDTNTIAIGARAIDGNNQTGYTRIFTWNGSAWELKGSRIDGEGPNDLFGHAVSMPDTNTVGIGARLNDGNGTNSGHVRIFKWNGTSWIQKGRDINGEAANDYSGHSICMPDSNTIAIGASGNDGNESVAGHVRIFSWNGISWNQKGLDIDGSAENDLFGYSVSMPDTNTIAIGAPQAYKTDYSGYVQIYKWNGIEWVQKGNDIFGETNGDYSGYSVSMADSNTVAIGSTYNSGELDHAGHVRIFKWNGSDWEQNKATIEGEAMDDYSGQTVSMPDTNTVAVGAPSNDGNGTSSGHVRIFSLCNTLGVDVITACNSYTWIDGNTYEENNNTATYIIPNAAGCDSIITLNLTINTVDVSVTNESPMLTANATDATYQWLDCNDDMSIITGETNQSFTATNNGEYAVEVTQNGCVDTSICEVVNNLSIMENDFENTPKIYPNPTGGSISVDLTRIYTNIDITIKNSIGQEISRQKYSNKEKLQLNIEGETGIYLIEIKADNKRALLKVVKE